MGNDKPKPNLLRRLGRRIIEAEKNDPEKEPLELRPAMPELGTAPCPVCGHGVTVFVTRTKRPFINCGFCSARIFYNGSRSMGILKARSRLRRKAGGSNEQPTSIEQYPNPGYFAQASVGYGQSLGSILR